jgi:uncharacterized protein (DUF1778 family)
MTPRPSRWVGPEGPSDKTLIKIRANKAQREAFSAAAQAAGKTVSGWMRDLAIEATEAQQCPATSASA